MTTQPPAPLSEAERHALASGLEKIKREEEHLMTTDEIAAVAREKVLNGEW